MKLIDFKTKRNLKNKDLAQMFGVEEMTISRYIRGEAKPCLDVMARIRHETGGLIDIEDFLDNTPAAKGTGTEG